MSYAGPANPKTSARSPLKQAKLAPRPTSATDRNAVFITGVILGAALGAGVALLLAPRSGRSTRRRLARSGRRVRGRARDAWHDLAGELRDARRRRKDAPAPEDRPAGDAQRRSFSFRAASSL